MAVNYWQTENIRIRAYEECDIEREIGGRNSQDSILQLNYDYIREPLSPAEMRAELETAVSPQAGKDIKKFVVETVQGEYAGEVRVLFTEEQYRLFKYGIFIVGEHRRKGFAKQALIIVLDYYFNELNYQKAISNVYDFNAGSRKFHEEFGFMQEGVLRREIFTRGKYCDMIYYGLLREEFNSLYKHFNMILEQ